MKFLLRLLLLPFSLWCSEALTLAGGPFEAPCSDRK